MAEADTHTAGLRAQCGFGAFCKPGNFLDRGPRLRMLAQFPLLGFSVLTANAFLDLLSHNMLLIWDSALLASCCDLSIINCLAARAPGDPPARMTSTFLSASMAASIAMLSVQSGVIGSFATTTRAPFSSILKSNARTISCPLGLMLTAARMPIANVSSYSARDGGRSRPRRDNMVLTGFEPAPRRRIGGFFISVEASLPHDKLAYAIVQQRGFCDGYLARTSSGWGSSG
jgi:hypothetical protein